MTEPDRELRAQRLGAGLRRIPGAAAVLDARLALRDRRVRRGAERREAALQVRDRELVASLGGRSDLRLNIGSSGAHIDGWISADLLRDPEGRCVRMDATEPWPFAAGSAEAVNAEHMIEHLEREAAPKFIDEAFRVLRPGGVIRISTPDLEGICRAYLEGDPEVLDAHRAHGYEARNHADMVNNYVYLWGHRHIYDHVTLAALLGASGFIEIESARFGRSRHGVLDGIDQHDPGALGAFVVCVDAVRP